MHFSFVANLRPQTVDSFEGVDFQPYGWLLSTHRLTRETLRLAAWVRDENLPLYADNGSKDLIDQVVERFKTKAAPVGGEIQRLRRSLPDGRRIPRSNEVPDTLRVQASDLAHAVVDEVEDLIKSYPTSDVLSKQLSMAPTHLFAQEDFAVVCLISLGLEREIIQWPVSYFDRRNQHSLNLWERVVSDPRTKDLDVFAVLSAMDYNTAFSAGRLAAKRGATQVAIGVAGINLDQHWVRSFLIANRHIQLPGSGAAPRRYVRLAQIIRGIANGFREEKIRLKAFHCLGLGASAQFPIVLAALDWYTNVTVDATSPLLDSVQDRVFYDPNNRGERLSVEEAATAVLGGNDWPFLCPFCKKIQTDYGHDSDSAITWWTNAGKPAISRDMLHPDKPLGSALPLFATARGPLTGPMTRARTAHNHWVLDQLAKAAPSSKRRKWALREMEQLISSRQCSTAWGIQAARAVLDFTF